MSDDPLRPFDGIVRRLGIAGAPAGPLAGTTFVAKDLYDLRGYPTGAGNPDWERTHEIATATAPALEMVLAAGTTLVGKSCSDELAFSLDGVNVHYGTPVNPRFPARLPGGSSSGSVSAVAAGLVDFALGTDKTAPADELAANRVKDLTLGSVASLSGSPQVSIPIVSDTYAIGLSFLGAPGEDARLLALAERLTA